MPPVRFIEVTKGATQSTTTGEITVEAPDKVKIVAVLARLLSGEATIDKITQVKIVGKKPSGKSSVLVDLSGTQINNQGIEKNITTYATNNQLLVPLVPDIKTKDKALLSQFAPAVDSSDSNKSEDHYARMTVTIKMTSATSAIYAFTFLCLEYGSMSKVMRQFSFDITLLTTSGGQKYPISQSGPGDHQYWAGVWLQKSSAAVISDFKVGGDGNSEPFNLPYTQMAQLLTDFGFTPGSTFQYHWDPTLLGFDNWLDTAKDCKNPYLKITSDTEETATVIMRTIGDL